VKERPLIFTGESIPLIFSGHKTQTRRVVTRTNSLVDGYPPTKEMWGQLEFERAWVDPGPSPAGNPGPYLKVPRKWEGEETVHRVYSRFCQVDQFWVREAWCHKWDENGPIYNAEGNLDQSCVHYRADGGEVIALDDDCGMKFNKDGTQASPWTSPIHMPRWASRADLLNKGVRVERLLDIQHDDCIAEGVRYIPDADMPEGWPENGPNWLAAGVLAYNSEAAFYYLWNSVNEKRGYPTNLNPLVWVIEFELIDKTS